MQLVGYHACVTGIARGIAASPPDVVDDESDESWKEKKWNCHQQQ